MAKYQPLLAGDQADVDVAIVGTGFAGIGMAIRLKQAEFDAFTVLEQAGDVGGTWRDNTYPGAACDVQSHLYCFSFEKNPDWRHEFGRQPGILGYLRHCVDKYGVRPHLRFHTEVTGADFDEDSGLWRVELNGSETLTARALVSGAGGLSRPNYPDIPGLESFRGEKFHSSRWNHDYDLAGKRVAVIGTGASAIQFVPQIAPEVAQLHLFQRTPPWIMPRPDRAIDEGERRWYRRLPILQGLQRLKLYLMLESRALGFVVNTRIMKMATKLGEKHIRRTISDPALRRKVTPDYTPGCKRILISNDYYPSLERENVNLVTDGILEITPAGVITRDGTEHEVDAIIMGTGFQAAEMDAPFPVRGRGGRSLDQAWADGPEAYKGTTVAGFPNLFMIVGPNCGLGYNSMVLMIESQIRYIVESLKLLRRRRLKFMDVRREAQDRYNRRLQKLLESTVWQTGGCVSWYQTRSGKNTTLWPGFTWEFRWRLRRPRAGAYELVPQEESTRGVIRAAA